MTRLMLLVDTVGPVDPKWLEYVHTLPKDGLLISLPGPVQVVEVTLVGTDSKAHNSSAPKSGVAELFKEFSESVKKASDSMQKAFLSSAGESVFLTSLPELLHKNDWDVDGLTLSQLNELPVGIEVCTPYGVTMKKISPTHWWTEDAAGAEGEQVLDFGFWDAGRPFALAHVPSKHSLPYGMFQALSSGSTLMDKDGDIWLCGDDGWSLLPESGDTPDYKVLEQNEFYLNAPWYFSG